MTVEIRVSRSGSTAVATITIEDADEVVIDVAPGRARIAIEGVGRIAINTSGAPVPPEGWLKRYSRHRMSVVRSHGRRIDLGGYAVYVYGGRLYIEGCWRSDTVVYMFSIPLDIVRNAVEMVRGGVDVVAALGKVAESQRTKTVRRALRSPCARQVIAALISKVLGGEVALE